MYLVLLLIVIIFAVIIIRNNFKIIEETMINIPKSPDLVKWQRNKCEYYMNSTLTQVLKDYKLDETKVDDWGVYFPCTYNYIDKEIAEMKPTKEDQKIFIIHNADQIAAKNALWNHSLNMYGRETAKKLMPDTYLLYRDSDLAEFKKNYDPSKLYIMKKNVQRQEGIKITNDLSVIEKGFANEYVVVQELLQNPYLIDGRKINMRVYVLIVCNKGEIDFYAHRNGFMYYTKNKFVKNSKELDDNITTGYVDRKVYEVNPLTLEDLRNYFDSTRELSDVERRVIENNQKLSVHIFNNIYSSIYHVLRALKPNICNSDKLKSCYTFELFGVDVALNHNLEAQIMEMNKGPDLSAKDERDKQVKYKVMTDILRVMRIIEDGQNHNFIELKEM